MKRMFAIGLLAALIGLGGCSGVKRETAIGAGVGAVGGNVLMGGSTAGTVGGAAVGGYIGSQYGKDKK